MWIPIQFLGVESAILTIATAASQWRVVSWVVGVVLCCVRVASLQETSPDISNMAAYTGKLFYVSFTSHPVYGSREVSLQLAAMSGSAEDQFPAWLQFNSSSRSLSGVPLPRDEGAIHLSITATCTQPSGPRNIYADKCLENSTEVFELTVFRCPWMNNQVSSVSVASPLADKDAIVPSPGCGVGHAMSVDADCEGARVVASLVLCSTSEQLTSKDRLDLMLNLSEFLTIPVSSITLEPSSAHLLFAIRNGFHMVSAGPGLDGVCQLSHNMEILWWLPCATVKHLNDFIRVLQHNVDGGRLQREIGATIVGWYIASSNSVATRQSRRRRAAGYQTVVPTPVLSPLKPTTLVASAQVDSVMASLTDLPPQVVLDLSTKTVPIDKPTQTVPKDQPTETVTIDLSSRTVPIDLSSRTVPIDKPPQTVPTDQPTQTVTIDLSSRTVPIDLSSRTVPIDKPPQTVPTDQPTQTVTIDMQPQTVPKDKSPQTEPIDNPPQTELIDKPSQTVPRDKLPQTVLFIKDDPVIIPKSWKQIETDLFPSTTVSEHSTLFPDNLAEITELPFSSQPSYSSDMTSSSSSTRKISSQLLTKPSWTLKSLEQHHISTEWGNPDATFSYSSSQQFVHAHSISSPLTPNLPVSYFRPVPGLSLTFTTQHHPELNATRSTWQPAMQSPADATISSVAPDTISDLSPWWRSSSGATKYVTSGLLLADDARLSSSLLYPSLTSIDWIVESKTEAASSSFEENIFSFDDIQTRRRPSQMPFPESSSVPEIWLQPSQISDSSTLLASFMSLSLTSANLVISRDVEVIAPLFTPTQSVHDVDPWMNGFSSTSSSTSGSLDMVTYFEGSDLRGKYNLSPYADHAWDTSFHAHSNTEVLSTQHSFTEQSQELDASHLPSWSSVPQVPRLSQSAQIQTHSPESRMLPLYPLYTSHTSVATLEIVVDGERAIKFSDSKLSTMMVERDRTELSVVSSIRSQVGSFSNSFITSISPLDMSPSADPLIYGDKLDQSTVAAETITSRPTVPRSGMTSVVENTTSETTTVVVNTTSVPTPGLSPFLPFLTSPATKRPRHRTTTSAVTRAKTTVAAETTTTSTTTRRATTTTPTTTQKTSTNRPGVRKLSTPKMRPTTQRTTTDWGDEDDVYPDYNNRPYVQRSIAVIRADQGKLLEFLVPHDVFYDIEDGDTRHLSLSLELPSNQVLPDNFWLYIESAQQVIKALPLHEDMDVKNMSVVLVARDKQGLVAADYITLQINDTPRRSFTHVFRMKFAIGFLQFMHSRRNITQLMERIGHYFGDDGAKFMTVLEVRQGSFIMSWTNNSLTGPVCPTDTIRNLYAHMVRRDGAVRQTFSRHIGRHLYLKEVQLQPWGSCIPTASTTVTSTSTKSTSTHLVSEVKAGHGFSVWAHVILPVLIAVLVFILIILVIIFCSRRRRQQQATSNAEKEVISNDANPIIFPSECPPDDLSSKPRDPQLSPVAELQPNQNTSAGSSQVKNNLNRDQERARKSRDNREQEWLNKDTQIHDQDCEREWCRNFHRKHTKDSSSGRRHRDADRTSRVSACSTLSWDRPNNHYLEEEADSRSSTLKSTKSAGSDKRHRKSPPPYWQHQTDPPPYRMPPPYLSNN